MNPTLLNPAGLWTLAALAPLVALYLLKKHYRPLQVASHLLWARALRSTTADRLWQKLRFDPIFILQVLLLALLSLVAGESGCLGRETFSERTVVVLDVSLSMAAQEDGGRRLDLARGEIRRRLESRAPGDAFALVAAGARPTLLTAFTRESRALDEALERARVHYEGADLEAALALARSIALAAGGARIVVVSDRPRGGDEHVQVGTRSDNLALTSIVADDDGISLGVSNTGPKAATARVVLKRGGFPIDAKDIALPQGRKALVSFPLHVAGPLEASLETEDALQEDNLLRLVVPSRDPWLLVVAGTPDIFTLRVLESLAASQTSVKVEYRQSFLPSPRDALVVFSKRDLDPSSQAACLVVDPPESVGGVALAPVSGDPSFFHVDTHHSVLRYCRFDDCLINASRTPVQPSSVIPLVSDAFDHPIIFALEREGPPAVVFPFSMDDTNLGARPAYPILLANLVSGALERARSLETALVAGRTHEAMPEGTLTGPGGTAQDTGSSWLLEEPGWWTYSGPGGVEKPVAVNALVPSEADISPEVGVENPHGAAKRVGERVWSEWRIPLGIAAMVFLALEWVLFMRSQGVRPW